MKTTTLIGICGFAILAILALIFILSDSGNLQALDGKYTQEEAMDVAKEFVLADETFKFDGMADTLKIYLNEAYGPGEYEFIAEFDCAHGGYGDRTGQMVTQAITPHKAYIAVDKNKVTAAMLDGQWDMFLEMDMVDQ
ncbi:hypothetical protein CUJ83_07080 [Methanocella sp. CWC-04]|uniref:Uncharacterized protein n=1 Tax=Methanooceanicella nereidis TaxID=2052831 RepID=A0AAP2REU1_9EURY|nr:hypothetical protein [Methanocella sp. CWC-04]MCD1294760.1 hypothetical protein [Methanocella sp. CWC-04]